MTEQGWMGKGKGIGWVKERGWVVGNGMEWGWVNGEGSVEKGSGPEIFLNSESPFVNYIVGHITTLYISTIYCVTLHC